MIYALCGPGGAGKDTILDKIHKKGLAKSVVSYTTRPKRRGEIEGKSYHFISREDFEAKIQSGEFVEHVQFNDNYYGLPSRDFDDAFDQGIDSIVVVESEGLKQLQKLYPGQIEAIYVFTSAAELRNRMHERGDKPATVDARMARLDLERQLLEGLYQYKVRNGDRHLQLAVDMVASIIKANLARVQPHEITLPGTQSIDPGLHGGSSPRAPEHGC